MEKDNGLKTIKILLVVLIITTAATAGLTAFNMIQSAPVATYFAKAMVASGYYDENGEQVDKNKDGKLVDSAGKLLTDQTVYDDYGSAYVVDKDGTPQIVEEATGEEDVDDGVMLDEDGNPIEDTEEITLDETDVGTTDEGDAVTTDGDTTE